jgi:hypothetical protein
MQPTEHSSTERTLHITTTASAEAEAAAHKAVSRLRCQH